MLFSDHHLAWKAGVGLVLLLTLLVWGGLGMDAHHPSFEDCAADPDRYRGRDLTLGPLPVELIRRGGGGEMVLRKQKTRIRILGAIPGVTPGDRVSVAGEFVPPDSIRPARWARHPGYLWKRGAMWVTSGAAILLLVAFLARRYRIRIGSPMFVPRS